MRLSCSALLVAAASIGCTRAETRLTGASTHSAADSSLARPSLSPGPQLELVVSSPSPSASASAPTPQAQPAPCAEGMVLVEGSYCPEVEQVCLRYLDPPGRYHDYRCAQYREPAKCLSAKRVPMRFCMDREEYGHPGSDKPDNHLSLRDAQRVCGKLGRRACTEREWNFACEGEEMRPYPYGFVRDTKACNADRTDILSPGGVELLDLRAAYDSHPKCVSPFGVHHLSGNLEEFVSENSSPWSNPVMKGSHWQPGRNHCRARQTAHGAAYSGIETGFRCCSDP